MRKYCLLIMWVTLIAFAGHGVCLCQAADGQDRFKRIKGVVVDESGAPVENAVVCVGRSQSKKRATTNEEGRFNVGVLRHKSADLYITAEGKAPLFREVESGDTPDEVRLQMENVRDLKLRIVDQQGDPVPHAGVHVYYAGEWWLLTSERAGEDGRFVWHGAPAEVECVVYQDRYAFLKTKVSAGSSEHQITLLPSLRFSGSVTDKQTGEPVERFTVIPVTEDLMFDSLVAYRRDGIEYSGGEYSIECDNTKKSYRVRVEARGYRTALSDNAYRVGDPEPVCNFQLERASPLTGSVVDNEGEPVSGARVYLATASQYVWLEANKEQYGCDAFYVDTDGEGKFEFPSQIEPYSLVVVHDLGYGETTLHPDVQPGQIEIEPWGRVEGTLYQSGQPVPSAYVRLPRIRSQLAGATKIEDSFRTTTDKNGRYEFPRVPPGKCQLKSDLNVWEEFPIVSSQSIPLDIQPGESLRVDLGRDGAEVVGRVVLTGKVPPQFQFRYSINYLVCKKPGIEPPSEIADLAAKQFSWRDGWSDSWLKTQEGRLYLNTLHHHFVKFALDGSFRISGVCEGEHDLRLSVFEPPEGCLTTPIATGIIPVRVAESDIKNGCLDLGDIELETSFGPQKGELVPDFEFETVAGDTAQLSQSRGKYVLLDFWATWCAPCVAKLPDVRQLHETYGKNGQLVVVGMNIDKDKGKARQFVKERTLNWQHGFLGDWSDTPLPTQLGISSVPTYVLIDPQGKLAFRSVSSVEMSEKISELLDGEGHP